MMVSNPLLFFVCSSFSQFKCKVVVGYHANAVHRWNELVESE
jgi:hypothetical protein